MKAFLLAAGQGNRLRPYTQKVPKPLVPILGKPLIEYVLDVLAPHTDEFIIVVGYKEEQIKKHLGNKYKDIPITYIEQKERRGTGHAVMLCKDYVKGDFLMMYADEILDDEAISELAKCPAGTLAFESDHPEDFGVITVDDDMNLLEIEEKPKNPKSNLVSGAAFKLTPKIFDHYPPPIKNDEYYLSLMIPSYMKEQPMKAVRGKMWLTVNRPEDIEKVESTFEKLNN